MSAFLSEETFLQSTDSCANPKLHAFLIQEKERKIQKYFCKRKKRRALEGIWKSENISPAIATRGPAV
jgi:hypothetical protein